MLYLLRTGFRFIIFWYSLAMNRLKLNKKNRNSQHNRELFLIFITTKLGKLCVNKHIAIDFSIAMHVINKLCFLLFR